MSPILREDIAQVSYRFSLGCQEYQASSAEALLHLIQMDPRRIYL